MEKHATTVFAESMAQFDESRAWASKYLHPPSETPSAYAGICDNNNSPSIHMELRHQFTNIPHLNNANNKLANLYLVAPGFLNEVYEALSLTDSNDWVCEPLSLAAGGNDVFGQYNRTVEPGSINYISALRQAYGSTTFTLNTNELTNSGAVTAASFRPNVYNFTSFNTLLEHYGKHANASQFLARAKKIFERGVTNDDDYVEVGKPRPAPTPFALNTASIQVVKLGRFITNEQDITQFSPKAYSEVAKNGAFVRQFFSQPTATYKDVGNQSAVDGTTPLTYCAYEFINNAGVVFVNFFKKARNGSTTKPEDACLDFPWSDMKWYYVMFSNLDPASGTTLKTLRGWEIQATMGSLLNTQSRVSCLPDNKCLESVAAISHVSPDALAAKFNALGANACAKETINEGGDEAIKVAAALGSDKVIHDNAVDKVAEDLGQVKKTVKRTHAKVKQGRPINPERNKRKIKQSTKPRTKTLRTNNTGKRTNISTSGKPHKDVQLSLKKKANKEMNIMKQMRKLISQMKL